MSSNSSNERLGFCRPNHNDQSKPYPNGLCVRSDLRVRTPSLLAHITCQRACSPANRNSPTAPKANQPSGCGQGLNYGGRTSSPVLSALETGRRPKTSPTVYRRRRVVSTISPAGYSSANQPPPKKFPIDSAAGRQL